MEQLIPLVNKLQDALASAELSEPINLPQIVVVGSQSAGKSSVLESLVGKDFLPRGSGIVTRRPLVLQLINSKDIKNGPALEWGEFAHTGPKQFTDFNAIRQEIEAETDKVAGKGKGVSSSTINLRVYSPKVLNLTLVDLPGLTRIAVAGQPKDIEVQIRKMAYEFVKNPNAIILAVSPANADLANSDALNLARDVDPDGLRTIGVLTKLDIMDKGTNALDVLQGLTYKLRLGFIGVVNRTQKDITDRITVDVALDAERKFFENHPDYSKVKARCGYQFLAQTLNKLLLNAIRSVLPELKQNVVDRLKLAQIELKELGDGPIGTNKSATFLNILTQYSALYCAAIDGQLRDLPTHSLYGGSRINYIFVDIYGKWLEYKLDSNTGLTNEDMVVALANASGTRKPLFLAEHAFDQLVQRQVSLLLSPSLQCADLVLDELMSMASVIDVPEMKRYPRLKERIVEVVHSLLRASDVPARKLITRIVEMERDFINTSHPDFIGGNVAIGKAIQERAAYDAANQEQLANKSGSSASGKSRTPSDIPLELAGQYEKNRNDAMADRSRKETDVKSSQVAEPSSKGNAGGGGFFGNFSWIFSKQSQQPQQQSIAKQPTPSAPAPPPAHISASYLPSNDISDFNVHVLSILLKSYFDIVKQSVRDRVPKVLMHFLVNHSKSQIQNDLVQQLYKEDIMEDLLRESSDIVVRRQKQSEYVELLRTVLSHLSDFDTSKLR